MNNDLSNEEVEFLLDHFQPEGRPRLFFGREAELDLVAGIPVAWKAIIAAGKEKISIALRNMDGVRHVLPKTLKTLRTRLLDVALFTSESKPPSLLYFFREGSELMGQRGYPPANDEELGRVPSAVLPLIADFYCLHNGWVDLFGADGGPLPIAEWQHIFADEAGFSHELFTVYANGTHKIGFECLPSGVRIHSLWPEDDSVQRIDDFWLVMDEEMALNLEDCDPNGQR